VNIRHSLDSILPNRNTPQNNPPPQGQSQPSPLPKSFIIRWPVRIDRVKDMVYSCLRQISETLCYEHEARKTVRASGVDPSPLLWCSARPVPVSATNFSPLSDAKYSVLGSREANEEAKWGTLESVPNTHDLIVIITRYLINQQQVGRVCTIRSSSNIRSTPAWKLRARLLRGQLVTRSSLPYVSEDKMD